MSRQVGYLGFGSNVGERESAIARALELIGERAVEVLDVSSLYETEPVGEVLEQPDFLNAAARIATTLEPLELLDACKSVEAEMGRHFGGVRHGPRPIDVDLLLLGDIELAHERLRLPHREVRRRRFVLVPLLELDPDLALPDGTRLDRCLDQLGPGQEVELAGRLAR